MMIDAVYDESCSGIKTKHAKLFIIKPNTTKSRTELRQSTAIVAAQSSLLYLKGEEDDGGSTHETASFSRSAAISIISRVTSRA